MELPSSFSFSAVSSAAGDAGAIFPRTSTEQGLIMNTKSQLIIGHKGRLDIGSRNETRSVVECQVEAVHSGRG